PQKQFNAEQIAAIKAGKEKIPGFTWHHHQDTGRMQLIDQDIHKKTGHIGGGINNGK
ncbi:HNH endonuclease, partial [Aggregatibacter aphrophilus]